MKMFKKKAKSPKSQKAEEKRQKQKLSTSANNLKSRVKIKIKSLNQEKKLNLLSKQVKLFNVDRLEKNITNFEIEETSLKTTRKFLLDNQIEILEIQSHGIKKHLKTFFKSWGIIAAALLLTLTYAVQYNFILKVQIDGTVKLSQTEIAAFIEDNLPSHFKAKIDTQDLEIKLKANFERISAVSAAIIGQTLAINISEAYIPNELEGDFQPILSTCDGIITDIDLVQGTLAVKVGDVVRKGEPLVLPYIVDTDGEQREVKPEAKIQADVWLYGESKHSDYSRRIERTGNKKEYSEVYLHGIKIYSNKKSNPFSQFELEEHQKILSQNLILPLTVKYYTYYETHEVIENLSFSQVETQKIAEARQNALIYLQESEIIKNETYTIKSVAGVSNVNYVITVSREIGGNK